MAGISVDFAFILHATTSKNVLKMFYTKNICKTFLQMFYFTHNYSLMWQTKKPWASTFLPHTVHKARMLDIPVCVCNTATSCILVAVLANISLILPINFMRVVLMYCNTRSVDGRWHSWQTHFLHFCLSCINCADSFTPCPLPSVTYCLHFLRDQHFSSFSWHISYYDIFQIFFHQLRLFDQCLIFLASYK